MSVNSELALSFAVAEPMKLHIHCLCLLGLDFIIYDSFRCRVVGLGWGARLWVTHFGEYLMYIYSSFAFRNNAPSSASAADNITAFMVVAFVIIAPLFGGNRSLFDRKKFPPAWLLELFLLQYPMSLCMHRNILLATYVIIASSCVAQ